MEQCSLYDIVVSLKATIEYNLASVKYALDNNIFNEGNTLLMIASKKNKLEIVTELLKRGPNINLQNKDGKTALMIASYTGNINIVIELLNNRANLNSIIISYNE
jgi:ankyrin repeat protein